MIFTKKTHKKEKCQNSSKTKDGGKMGRSRRGFITRLFMNAPQLLRICQKKKKMEEDVHVCVPLN